LSSSAPSQKKKTSDETCRAVGRVTVPFTEPPALWRSSSPIWIEPVSLKGVDGVTSPAASPARAVIGLNVDPVG
jgi:hypothetical protein